MAYNPFWFFTSHATTFSTQLVKFVCFLFTLFSPCSLFFLYYCQPSFTIFSETDDDFPLDFFPPWVMIAQIYVWWEQKEPRYLQKIKILKATAHFFIKIYGKFMNYFANSWSVTLFDQFQEVSIKAVTNCVFSYFHRRCKHTLGPRETANNTFRSFCILILW